MMGLSTLAVATVRAQATDIYDLSASSGGYSPTSNAFYTPALLATDGTYIYGITASGGSYGYGTIFKVKPDGTAFALLHSFTGGPNDGAIPCGGLLLLGGALYGTTGSAGLNHLETIFKMNLDGTAYQILYSYQAPTTSSIVQLSGNTGALVSDGTYIYGVFGSQAVPGDLGKVFRIRPDGSGFTVLHAFAGSDGSNPECGLSLSNGILYGTTTTGGSFGDGVIFSLRTDGSNYTVLHSFSGADGNLPLGNLVVPGDGRVYGTTHIGGTGGGVIFAIGVTGSGYAVLRAFSGSDGIAVPNGLTIGSDGLLYGSTIEGYVTGSAINRGTIFRIAPNGTGFASVATLPFPSTNYAMGTLLQYGSNHFCGLAAGNLTNTFGFVFTLTPNPVYPTVITSANAALAVAGIPFTYTISANNSPTSFTVTNLPQGLTLNSTTGVISGVPTVGGNSGTYNYNVTLGAVSSVGNAQSEMTIIVAAPVPVLTSPKIAGGVAGQPFSYTITATNAPTSFNAVNLPAGLSINQNTGVISGTPTGSSASGATISASNASGTASEILSLLFSTGTPSLVGLSSIPSAMVGVPYIYSIQTQTVNSFSSFNATGLPPGLTVNTSTGVISGTPTTAGSYSITLSASYSLGTASTPNVSLAVLPQSPAPAIGGATSADSVVGSLFSYSILSAGNPTAYTASGLPAGLSINSTTGVIAGAPLAQGVSTITIGASSLAGTAVSNLTLNVSAASSTIVGSAGGPAAPFSDRLIDASTRGLVAGTISSQLVGGFIISGSTPKQVLIRAIGPGLTAFGVPNVLGSPTLQLFDGSGNVLSSNKGWQNAPNSDFVRSAVTQVGAFTMATADSAILVTLPPGAYSTEVSDTDGTAGVALAEVYDADTSSYPGSKLVNLSTRGVVGSGSQALIMGFVISGVTPQTVLIRGIGPGLAQFGVTNVVAAPNLTVYSGSTVIAMNNQWATPISVGSSAGASAAAISAAESQAGAFGLTAGTNDTAVLITLQPGAYTAQLGTTDGTSGAGLVEVYLVPTS